MHSAEAAPLLPNGGGVAFGVRLRLVVRLPLEAMILNIGLAAAIGVIDAARRDGGAPLAFGVLPAVGILGERRAHEHDAEGGKHQKPCHFYLLPDGHHSTASGQGATPYIRSRNEGRTAQCVHTTVITAKCSAPARRSLIMCSACFNVLHMSTMIQIRNVPDELHRELKSRAALAGMSLSDYLLAEIRQVAERPTLDELRARLQSRQATNPSVAPADAVRAERDRR
jgi:plasmid stability protein